MDGNCSYVGLKGTSKNVVSEFRRGKRGDKQFRPWEQENAEKYLKLGQVCVKKTTKNLDIFYGCPLTSYYS